MTVRILVGDALAQLRTLEAESVQCCVTSPPYYGLRDYGIAGQIGREATPAEYIERLVAVFAEVRRVLRADGTLWVNIGDSYAANRSYQVPSTKGGPKHSPAQGKLGASRVPDGMKPKDLIGIPWMLAFALRDDGWYLRQEIIWHKPNPMPEAVKDRPTRSHEQLFLLSKSERYLYDAAAIAEGLADSSTERLAQDVEGQNGSARANGGTRSERPMKAVGGRPQLRRARELFDEKGLTDDHLAAIRACGISDAGKALTTTLGAGKNDERMKALAAEAKEALGGYYREFLIPETRNRRSVWTVPTMPYKGAHFAVFPLKLVEPCVLAGAPTGSTVLDPFGGAGTTGLIATRHGRDAVLVELNPDYARLAETRIRSEAPLLSEVQVA